MSDHRRRSFGNREDLPDFLLQHARTDGPTQQARAHAFSRIVAAGAATTGIGLVAASLANKSATVSVAKIGTLIAAKWFVIGATAATAMLGAKEVVEHFVASPSAGPSSAQERNDRTSAGRPGRAPERPSVASGEVMPSTPAPELAVAEAKPSRDAVPRLVEPPSEGPIRSRTTPAAAADLAPPLSPAVTHEEPAASASPHLSRELELLEKTRTHLARQSPWAALDVLETYQASFPTGTMKTEASALRVEALAAAGRRAEALSHGRAFLAANPQNALSERVRGILVRLEAPSPRR